MANEIITQSLAMLSSGSSIIVNASLPTGKKVKFKSIFVGFLPKQFILIQFTPIESNLIQFNSI